MVLTVLMAEAGIAVAAAAALAAWSTRHFAPWRTASRDEGDRGSR